MASRKNRVINDNDRRNDAAGANDQSSRSGDSIAWVMNGFALHGYALYSPMSLPDRYLPIIEQDGSAIPANDEYYQPMTIAADQVEPTRIALANSDIELRPRLAAAASSSVVLSCIMGLARLVHTAWKAYQREREIGRAIARLSELDDHVLRDIGLHRSEIADAVRRGVPRDGRAPANV